MGTDNIIPEFFDKLRSNWKTLAVFGGIGQSQPATQRPNAIGPGPGHVDLASRPINELGPRFANFLYLVFLTWLSHFQRFIVLQRFIVQFY